MSIQNKEDHSNNLNKKKIILLNEINSKRFQTILDYSGIDINEIKFSNLGITNDQFDKYEDNIQIPNFYWNNQDNQQQNNEQQQVQPAQPQQAQQHHQQPQAQQQHDDIIHQLPACLTWLNNNIPLPSNNLIYKDVHYHQNLLYTSEYIKFLPYSLNGTCSFAVIPPYVKLFDKQIHMLIEIKKPFQSSKQLKSSIHIAICQLIASSVHIKKTNNSSPPLLPVLLLTDLNENWYFFWFSKYNGSSNTHNFSSGSSGNIHNDHFNDNHTIIGNTSSQVNQISFTNTTSRAEAKYLINYLLYRVFNIKKPVYRWCRYKFNDSLKRILKPIGSQTFSFWNFIKKYLIPCI